jgi:hypothetical protein
MGWIGTLIMLASGVVLSIYYFLSSRKPKQSLHVPLVPAIVILFLGILLIMIAGSHALTLLGIEHNRSQLRLN